MSLGERLYELRKSKNLSQEEVADKLNVTRQTVSKWETDESKPDFDKIIPICELFEIKSEELLTGNKEEVIVECEPEAKNKKALFISIAILLYFVAIIWTVIAEETFGLDDGLLSGVFMLICGVATAMLIYQGIALSTYKKEVKDKPKKDKKIHHITFMTAVIFCIIYLVVSFVTKAWHITWIIWLIFVVVREIIVIAYDMKGEK